MSSHCLGKNAGPIWNPPEPVVEEAREEKPIHHGRGETQTLQI
jgi:hypothetical protein